MNAKLISPKVLRTANEFISVSEAMDINGVADRLREHLEGYKSSSFELLVAGEVKKGKTTFINVLLDAPELLPTETQETTSVAWKIRYGESPKYVVYFNPTFDPENPEQILPARDAIEMTDSSEIEQYGTEDGNPGNEKEVSYIEVYLPHPLLETGLVITDTPGLGALFEEHGEIPWFHATTADAFCCVFDSEESTATRDDIANVARLLNTSKQLRGKAVPCFFLQTKIDTVESEHWQGFRDDNIAHIENLLGEHFEGTDVSAQYFPISSMREKSDPSSGFPGIVTFLEAALGAHADALAEGILQPMHRITSQTLLPRVELSISALKAGQKTDRMESERKRLEQEANIRKWAEDVFTPVLDAFNYEFEKISNTATLRVKTGLEPASDNPIVRQKIDTLKQRVDDRKFWQSNVEGLGKSEIERTVDKLQSACVGECNALISEVLEEFEEGTNDLIEVSAKKLFESTEYEKLITEIDEFVSDNRFQSTKGDLFETGKTLLGGMMTPVFTYSFGSMALTTFVASSAKASASATALAATELAQAAAVTASKAILAAASGSGSQAAAIAAAETSVLAAEAAAAAQAAAVATAGAATFAIGVVLVAAAAICMYAAYRHLKKTRILRDISEIEKALLTTLKNASNTVSAQLTSMVIEYKKVARDTFRQVKNEALDALNAQLRSMKEARNVDEREFRQKLRELEELKEQLSKLLETLNEMLGITPEPETAPGQ